MRLTALCGVAWGGVGVLVGEEPESPALPKLFSGPGLVAVLGIAALVLARLFDPGNVLRPVVTELVAGFGAAMLVLAAFVLLFRSGLARLLLRGAPGGETLAESAEHLREHLQNLDPQKLNESYLALKPS